MDYTFILRLHRGDWRLSRRSDRRLSPYRISLYRGKVTM